ncbi:MAG: helix-turn-helix domain-containing protein [Thaumarchaeota archaeon]|nr:helix-turn-helix domain-containing protein [Nitrososphaerota archaeon]
MGFLNYVFYFFGVMLIVGGVFGNNLPMFLLGVMISLPPLLERGLRRRERRDSSDDILSLIFDEKEKRVVEALIKSSKPLRLSEIAAITGLSKVTVYRLLKKLTARGTILIFEDNAAKVKRYYVNPKLKELFNLKIE